MPHAYKTCGVTFKNWCWRSSPRVSRPADPASARKQGVKATRDTGSCNTVEGEHRWYVAPSTNLTPIHQAYENAARCSSLTVVWNDGGNSATQHFDRHKLANVLTNLSPRPTISARDTVRMVQLFTRGQRSHLSFVENLAS